MNPYDHNPFEKKAPARDRESRSEYVANLQLQPREIIADRETLERQAAARYAHFNRIIRNL